MTFWSFDFWHSDQINETFDVLTFRCSDFWRSDPLSIQTVFHHYKLGFLIFKYIHLMLQFTVNYAQSMGKNIAISASRSNFVLLLTENIFISLYSTQIITSQKSIQYYLQLFKIIRYLINKLTFHLKWRRVIFTYLTWLEEKKLLSKHFYLDIGHIDSFSCQNIQ